MSKHELLLVVVLLRTERLRINNDLRLNKLSGRGGEIRRLTNIMLCNQG